MNHGLRKLCRLGRDDTNVRERGNGLERAGPVRIRHDHRLARHQGFGNAERQTFVPGRLNVDARLTKRRSHVLRRDGAGEANFVLDPQGTRLPLECRTTVPPIGADERQGRRDITRPRRLCVRVEQQIEAFGEDVQARNRDELERRTSSGEAPVGSGKGAHVRARTLWQAIDMRSRNGSRDLPDLQRTEGMERDVPVEEASRDIVLLLH